MYKILNSTIDYYTGESFYEDKMPAALNLLEEKGLTKISRDALIVDLEEYGLGAAMLKKSDEATLYLTRDLAAILYRREKFKFARILYVVGSAQALHFKQLFKIVELLGKDWHKDCRHVEFGWIKFGEEMMSTREGNIIFLDDVISKATQLAKEIILEKNSLPAICGRVCPQENQCQMKCVLGRRGDPVSIGRLERFVADWELKHGVEIPERAPPTGKRVAVIGSGPAGLFFLRLRRERRGHTRGGKSQPGQREKSSPGR